MDQLRARGHEIRNDVAPKPGSGATLVLSTPVDWMQLGMWLAHWHVARGVRLLVLSRVGAHPDARATGLRELWRLEEQARVSLIPTLALRLGPLLGSDAPLWKQLRRQPKLDREAARAVVMPLLESDAVHALDAALRRSGPWEGWYDLAGPEAFTLAELAALAAGTGATQDGEGQWEPPLEELKEHRLCESELWQRKFRVSATPISRWARAGVA
jgi:hypothetical protein